MNRVTLLPSVAVDRVCHDEQMRIWARDIAVALGMANYLSMASYEEILDVERIIQGELKSIMESAFNHPEAVTMANSQREV